MKRTTLLCALAVSIGVAGTSALAQEKRTILTLETAKKWQQLGGKKPRPKDGK